MYPYNPGEIFSKNLTAQSPFISADDLLVNTKISNCGKPADVLSIRRPLGMKTRQKKGTELVRRTSTLGFAEGSLYRTALDGILGASDSKWKPRLRSTSFVISQVEFGQFSQESTIDVVSLARRSQANSRRRPYRRKVWVSQICQRDDREGRLYKGNVV